MNGIGAVTEIVVGELLQPFQLGADGDKHVNALFNLEAKLNLILMSLKTCRRHFGVSDTLNNQINVGGNDGNHHCQAGPHRRSSAS
jgi:hypothetical protein